MHYHPVDTNALTHEIRHNVYYRNEALQNVEISLAVRTRYTEVMVKSRMCRRYDWWWISDRRSAGKGEEFVMFLALSRTICVSRVITKRHLDLSTAPLNPFHHHGKMEDLEPADIDPEMAAVMGFGAFGSQPSNKKRKFKHDQAIVAGAALPTVSSSGSNTVQLGIRKARPSGPAGASAEHPEDQAGAGSSVNNNPESSGYAGSDEPQKNLAGPGSGQEQSKQDTSGKKLGQQQRVAAPPSGLAQYLSRGQAMKDIAPDANAEMPANNSLADPSAPSADSMGSDSTSGPRTLSREELAALRRGVRNAQGDLAYFLPSFVEDPWAKT